MRAILFFAAVLVCFVSFRCKKENINEQLGIPYVNVSQYVFLNDPNFIGLNAVGGFAFLNGGSKGIVIYHRAFDEYVAFDRHCTWQTFNNCTVSPDSSTLVIMNCACCTSKYSLIDGSVINGPSINPLLQYNAQISSPGTLHVYN